MYLPGLFALFKGCCLQGLDFPPSPPILGAAKRLLQAGTLRTGMIGTNKITTHDTK